jgi:hypothetical protein
MPNSSAKMLINLRPLELFQGKKVKLPSELCFKTDLRRFDIDAANRQDMTAALRIVTTPLLTIEASGSP